MKKILKIIQQLAVVILITQGVIFLVLAPFLLVYLGVDLLLGGTVPELSVEEKKRIMGIAILDGGILLFATVPILLDKDSYNDS